MSGTELTTGQAASNTYRMDDTVDAASIQGSYYRVVSEIPLRNETTDRAVGHFDAMTEDGRIVETRAVRRAVVNGTVLLAVHVRFLDDMFHSVQFAAHPSDADQTPMVFMAEEFSLFFAKEPDGQAIRKTEMDDALKSLTRAQAALSDITSDFAFDPGPARVSSSFDLVVDTRGLAAVQQASTAMREKAEKMQSALETAMKGIGERQTVFNRFIIEASQAVTASIREYQATSGRLLEKAGAFALAQGEGVHVRTLVTGEAAAGTEPLTLYQSRLFLDEELAVNAASGGFIFEQMATLPALLQPGRGFLERLIPTPRGAVLVGVRRGPYRYSENAFEDFWRNEAAKAFYLLVRNGDNVHLVSIPVVREDTEFMFPPKAEIDRFFTSFGRSIRPEHLDYAEARTEFEKKSVLYRRLLITLWGLSDRLSLFGNFYDKEKFTSWFDPEFHAENVRYIQDAEAMLENLRPSWREWMRECNKALKVGSKVVFNLKNCVSPKAMPGLYKIDPNTEEATQIEWPSELQGMSIVQSTDNRLFAEVRSVKPSRTKPGKCEILIDAALRLDESAMLCLDAVSLEDIDYYLNARRERSSYLDFIDFFAAARRVLVADELAIKGIALAVEKTFADEKLSKDRAAEFVAAAIRLWRSNNAQRIPNRKSDAQVISRIASHLRMAFSMDAATYLDTLSKSVPFVIEHPELALSVKVDGHGDLCLYRELADGEKGPHVSLLPERSVICQHMRSDGSTSTRVTYLDEPAFDAWKIGRDRNRPLRTSLELEIKTFDVERVARYRGRHLPGWVDPAMADDTVVLCQQGFLDEYKRLSPEKLAERTLDIYSSPARNGNGRTGKPYVVLPIGVFLLDVDEEIGRSEFRLVVAFCHAMTGLIEKEDDKKAFSTSVAKEVFQDPAAALRTFEDNSGDREFGPLQIGMTRASISETLSAEGPVIDISGLKITTVGTGHMTMFGQSVSYRNLEEALQHLFGSESRKAGTLHYLRRDSEAFGNAWYERLLAKSASKPSKS